MKYLHAFVIGVALVVIVGGVYLMTWQLAGWAMAHIGRRGLAIALAVTGGLIAMGLVKLFEPPKKL